MSVSRLSRQSIQAGFPKQQSVWDGISQPAGMDVISSIALTSAQNAVSFSNVPQTYTHLQLRTYAGNVNAGPGVDSINMYFNNVTSSGNYAWHLLQGGGSSAAAANATGTAFVLSGLTESTGANTFAVGVTDILDYTNTNKNKTVRSLTGSDENNAGLIRLVSGVFLNTAAVSTILLTNNSAENFTSGSVFTLYGIR